VCADGTPNVSPKGTISVLDDDHLMFADIRSPGTVANLKKNPSVEVNIVDPFVRKGYRFKGRANVLEAGAEFERLLGMFVSRGVFDAPKRIRAIVTMRIDKASPLISPGYDRDTDEASVRAHWVRYYADSEGAA
jgi:hypothetical protein